jgi:hypothetical protein
MQKFELVLKNEKAKFYQRLGWFIILILTMLYAWFGFFTNLQFPKGRTIGFLSAMGIAFLLSLYFRNTKYRFGLFPFFILLIAGWILREQYLFAFITFFFEVLHELSSRKKEVIITETQIVYPSFPLKKIDWKKLNNTLLKDGLLTIDFKNNKFIQQLIDETKTSINEKEFNEFCKQQLKGK